MMAGAMEGWLPRTHLFAALAGWVNPKPET
jgi:hypothetical protein